MADLMGKLRRRLATQFAGAPTNDITTQLQRILGQEGVTSGGDAADPSDPLLTEPYGDHTATDLTFDLDLYLDRLTSDPSQAGTTPTS